MKKIFVWSALFIVALSIASCKKNAQLVEHTQADLVNNQSFRSFVARDLSKRV